MSNPLVTKLETVAKLSADDRQAIETICGNTRTVTKKRDIIREGHEPKHVFVVIEGWAARYKLLPNGARQITAFLIPGDLCNFEVTALKQMDHSVVALTDVKLAAVPRDWLIEMTRTQTRLAQAFWWITLVNEAILRVWVVNLGRRDAYARTAHLACELHGRMKHIGLATDSEFELPLTQEQLGDALGLTPVHVNRVLKRMREEGLIAARNRTLIILDEKRLCAAAGFDAGYLHS